MNTPLSTYLIGSILTLSAVSSLANEDIERISIQGSKLKTLQEEFIGSATVLNQDFSDAFQINRIRDLDQFVPNMQISQLGQMGGSFISLRGISSNPFVVNRTSVYIDGIPYREINNQLLHDISQIEILKGPQGTLYGSNTEAGVVIINTQKPTEELSADLTLANYWHKNGRNIELSATVSGALIPEKFNGRISTSVQRGDAFVINTSAIDGEQGNIKEASIQTDLYWQTNTNGWLRFLAMFESNKAPGLYEQEFVPSNLMLYNQIYQKQNQSKTLDEWQISHDVKKDTNEEEFFIALSGQQQFKKFDIDYSLSYQENKDNSAGVDIDLTAFKLFRGATQRKSNATHAEIRLSHQGRFSWLIGSNYYYNDKSQSLGAQNLSTGATKLSFQPPQIKQAQDYAVFASASYETEKFWKLELGGRYEHSSQSTKQDAITLFLPRIGALDSPAQDLTQDFSQFLPKISLSKKFEQAGILYTSASQGWLPGGFNLTAARQQEFKNFSRYDKETLWHYEVGYKISALDGRLFSSIALFYIDADNWQEFSVATNEQGQVASTNLVSSNGDVVSKGLEIELRYLPIPDLTLTAGLGLNKAYYKQYRFSSKQDYSGNNVPLIPRYDFSIAMQYDINENWYVNTHANFLGQTVLNTANSAKQSSYHLLNFRVGYRQDDWQLEAFAENLTGTRYFSGLAYDNFAFGRDGLFYAPAGNPRQLGVQFEWYY